MLLYETIHGGTQPGVLQMLSGVVSDLKVIKGIEESKAKDQQDRHLENTEKLDRLNAKTQITIAIGTIVGLIIAACAVAVTIMIFLATHGHAEVLPFNIFSPNQSRQVYSVNQQPQFLSDGWDQ